MAKAELGGVEVKKKRYLVMTVAAVLIMAAVAIFIQRDKSVKGKPQRTER